MMRRQPSCRLYPFSSYPMIHVHNMGRSFHFGDTPNTAPRVPNPLSTDTYGIGMDPRTATSGGDDVFRAHDRQQKSYRKQVLAKLLERYPPRPRDLVSGLPIPLAEEEIERVRKLMAEQFRGLRTADFIEQRYVKCRASSKQRTAAKGKKDQQQPHHEMQDASSTQAVISGGMGQDGCGGVGGGGDPAAGPAADDDAQILAEVNDAEATPPVELACVSHVARYHISQVQGVSKLLPVLTAAHRHFCSQNDEHVALGDEGTFRELRKGSWRPVDNQECSAALLEQGLPSGAPPIPFWLPVTSLPAQTRTSGRPTSVVFRKPRTYFNSIQVASFKSKALLRSLHPHYWATSGLTLPYTGSTFLDRQRELGWSARSKCWFRVDELEKLGLRTFEDVSTVAFDLLFDEEHIVHCLSDTRIFRSKADVEIFHSFPLPPSKTRDGIANVGKELVHVLFAGPRWESFPCDSCSDGILPGSETNPKSGTVYISPCAASKYGLLDMFVKSPVHREDVMVLRPPPMSVSAENEDVMTATEDDERRCGVEGEEGEEVRFDRERSADDEEEDCNADEAARVTVEQAMSRAKHLSKDFMLGLIEANKTQQDQQTGVNQKDQQEGATKEPQLESHVRENYLSVTVLRVKRGVRAVNASHVDFVDLSMHPETRIA